MTITVTLTAEVQEYFKYVPSDMYDAVINKLITDSLQKRTESVESPVVPTLESMREMFESVLSNMSINMPSTPVTVSGPMPADTPVATEIISYENNETDYADDSDDDDDIWK